MAKTDLKELAQGFYMLSDTTRLKILAAISKKPQNITSLCKAFKQKQPIISHHMGLLRMGLLVNGKRQGRTIIYSADKANLKALAAGLAKLMPK